MQCGQTGAAERDLDGTSGHPCSTACLFPLISYVSLGSGFLIYKVGELEKLVPCMVFLNTSAPAQAGLCLASNLPT